MKKSLIILMALMLILASATAMAEASRNGGGRGNGGRKPGSQEFHVQFLSIPRSAESLITFVPFSAWTSMNVG